MRLMRTSARVLAFASLTLPAAAQVQMVRPIPLRAVFDSVLRNHPLLQAANANVGAARGTRQSAGAFGNPVLSYQVENTAFPGGRNPTGLNRETMITAMLPLEPLYQRGPRSRAADAMVRAAEADGEVTRARIAMDAARAYYRVALAQVKLATAHDLANWFDSVVVYNRNRVHEGAAAEVDLIRSETERDRARADATLCEAELARARADLSVFLGDPRQVVTTFSVVADSVPLAMMAGADVRPRPEARAASERLSAANAEVSVEHAFTFRQVGAMFGVKQTAGTSSMIAGLSVPVPLFDANRGAVRRATGQREAAALELAAVERTTRADIAGSVEVARLLTDRAAALAAGGATSFLARADEARRITLGAYREGAMPLIQVIDAARAWSDARLTFYQLLYAQHESVLALLTAQGADLFVNLPSTSAEGVRTP